MSEGNQSALTGDGPHLVPFPSRCTGPALKESLEELRLDRCALPFVLLRNAYCFPQRNSEVRMGHTRSKCNWRYVGPPAPHALDALKRVRRD